MNIIIYNHLLRGDIMGYYVHVNNVKIFIEDLNPESKNAILFLHGWPGNHNLFEYQFDKLPQLGFRCIGIDTRGFGKSDKPFQEYDYDTLVQRLRELAFLNKGIKIDIIDERNDKKEEFCYEGLYAKGI